jgi:predicted RNA-binding protein with PUA-like domain
MAVWLFKSEPEDYSYADLVREKKTWWTGVSNALARKHLRTIARGDRVWLYHTGKEKAVVGEMLVTKGPQVDPETPDDDKSVVVEVKPAGLLHTPVTLATIKTDPVFEGWDLIRIGRLSVMPVPDAMDARLRELGT